MSQTSAYFPLATDDSWQGQSGSITAQDGTDAGAAGDSSANSITLSTGALVAIIIVVVVVILIGITTATLFFIAKKREWTIKETIRRSTKKVATALTPRRSEFPRSVKGSTRSNRRGRTKLEEVPPTPRLRPEDLEKGLARSESKSISQKSGGK
ncbi:hypothetical protein TsFJ059_004023 [Trichoderma semiorbis]|uniref:Uncharacterized protein n=6 Tax=Trichoderma TaxID=5543 RepID=A0A0F9ZVD2_TRIHA|nr:hypothetical protein T069G_02640 [Trichoderma breve]KAF3071694.1 hypothetical protein CFAM422_006533 [Trichoderma lentiforme]KAH0529255.1 hypothetical protein TsFJ059_004023 [Trichoderma semiorbis]KAK4073633.1 hypothetical protein Trihar35433_3107 [Trichoderma harzianum]OPB36404.1 hypothetical protein A0O28_0054830 [Trichoderma guizhouense]QYS95764.1 hypothetical protein H0G86_003038 [Trichoderma simmonsii]